MKYHFRFTYVLMIFSVVVLTSCSADKVKYPEYHSEISLDEDLQVTDWGRTGESADDDYYYYGSVTLYDEDGGSRSFSCYEGKTGLDCGCRGVIYDGEFYNLDRSEWVTIGGVRYKASN